MEKCICTKQEQLEKLDDRIRSIELKDVEKEKDLEKFQESLDKLNITLEELNAMIQELNSKPLQKYEKLWNVVTGGVIGALVAFIMNTILNGA